MKTPLETLNELINQLEEWEYCIDNEIEVKNPKEDFINLRIIKRTLSKYIIPAIFKQCGTPIKDEKTNRVSYTLKGEGTFCKEDDKYELKELTYTPSDNPEDEFLDVDDESYTIDELELNAHTSDYLEIILPNGEQVWFNYGE